MGFFRIGSEDYAVTNETYGLATMLKAHVTLLDEGDAALRLPGQARQAPDPVGRRRGRLRDRQAPEGPPRRAATSCWPTSEGRRWVDVRSPDINQYLKDAPAWRSRPRTSARGTRPCSRRRRSRSAAWQGTKTGRKRAVVRAIKEVAHYLGNTPAVARASYIDPRVFDRFNDGLVDRADGRARGDRARGPGPHRRRRRLARSWPRPRSSRSFSPPPKPRK